MKDTMKNKPNKKELTGRIVSDKMQKTIVVSVEKRILHPLYKKYITYSKRYKAHDEKEEAGMGDVVRIMECRPISKDKCWQLKEIVEKAR